MNDNPVQTIELPILADLDPIANFIAMRFALAGVSSNKIHQILEIFNYSCIEMEGSPPHICLNLAKLNSWLLHSRGDFKDNNAINIFIRIVDKYDEMSVYASDSERSRILKSIRDFFSILVWKYDAFAGKSGRGLQLSVALNLQRGKIKIKLYRSNKDVIVQVNKHAKDRLYEFCHTLEKVNAAIISLGANESFILYKNTKEIKDQLMKAVEAMPYEAKLAIGNPMVEVTERRARR